jgi:hypothetical protein
MLAPPWPAGTFHGDPVLKILLTLYQLVSSQSFRKSERIVPVCLSTPPRFSYYLLSLSSLRVG